ncbi:MULTISPECIES: glycosyltransferase family 2 protein [unclassified Flavobacterium]|jgi:glycosyltransferase involved in cell wall biosynthesis|uniref:glycosyltransferase family 2 protein n=1 Tax=unclassified Flavobacterium TaxID=196869 RepID=UPI0025C48A94|nr:MULTISPECIES: glycosyltransferase [unclassified Flavobacterium]
MLSILIPIYKYDAYSLISEIQKQAQVTGIDFEIISIDDASELYKSENNRIKLCPNCIYEELPQNLGRSKIRNLLASKAKYDWLLFMDCDTFPCNPDFMSNYIDQIFTSKKSVFFGGIRYKLEKPESEKLLRWEFGHKREAINLADRKKNPYKTAFISNFLIRKSVFETLLFDEKITEYGYEDFAFIHSLKNKNIEIQHIENPLYHLNLETSKLFLSKTKTALEMLLFISKNNESTDFESKITKIYTTLSYLKLHFLVSNLFLKLQLKLENNLTSKKPSLFVFDFYKIGYFCYLNTQ